MVVMRFLESIDITILHIHKLEEGASNSIRTLNVENCFETSFFPININFAERGKKSHQEQITNYKFRHLQLFNHGYDVEDVFNYLMCRVCQFFAISNKFASLANQSNLFLGR